MSVPKLRFKDENGQVFPDWEEKELGEIFDIVVGFVGTVSKFYCDKSDGIQFIRTLNVKDGYFSLDDIQYVTKEFHIKNRKSQINNEDILIARVGANMGMVCKVQGLQSEANSANVIIIRSSLTNNSEFYACYLRSSKGQKQIQAKGAGGAQEVLNISVTKTITVPVPILLEQTKIAEFLMAVDEKIAQLTKKCELLARYKKGVMQQIFSQELRFKDDDGRDFPDWEEKTFSQANIKVIDGDRGDNYPNSSDFSDDGYCLFLNAKNVTKSGFIFNEVSFISKEKDEVLRKGKLIRNDLILTTRGTVGNIAYFDKSIKYKNVRINSGMVIIRNECSNIDSNYLYKYFYSPRFRKVLEQITFGSAQPQLTVAEINKFKIGIPILKEQIKIANFLTSIDEKITEAQTYLDTVKQYKQGLLQQMFV